MQTVTRLALLVFLLTYALISVRRVRSVSIDRPAAALFGALLMIVLGVLPVDEVLGAIDLDIIALLLGMMIIVSCLEITGLFDRVSVAAGEQVRGPLHLPVGQHGRHRPAFRPHTQRCGGADVHAHPDQGLPLHRRQPRTVPGRGGAGRQHRVRGHRRGKPAERLHTSSSPEYPSPISPWPLHPWR